MRRIRIFIVDDSRVVRRMLIGTFVSDPTLEVVGTAANGRIALDKIPQVNPDVVILDLDMPEMGGLEALAEIRRKDPHLPVIVFSTLTRRGAIETLDALEQGANDFVTKPEHVATMDEAIRCIREELVPKIKAFCSKPTIPQAAPVHKPPEPVRPPLDVLVRPRGRQPVEIVAIGVSTGGPNALATLLPALPRGFPVPIVVVQHMPSIFTKLLAERLTAKSAIPISEAASGEPLEPAHAWLAPGNYHMIVERDGPSFCLRTHQGPPENSCRPSADVLFRSVAHTHGSGALAVMLTGMGEDGKRGCEEIVRNGGCVVAQDAASSVIWGMPGSVVQAGLASAVLPLSGLAGYLARRASVSSTHDHR